MEVKEQTGEANVAHVVAMRMEFTCFQIVCKRRCGESIF